ncbi:MAG: PQQ-dependent sugar dehydrogenase, partial [Chitinophagales bacterium]|nr:PQQ-dependent sugar dehydrogenase [Chitinophagales bacterium]
MTGKVWPLVAALLISIISYGQPLLELELYVSGFNDPVDIANAGDGRLFITEREGIIKVVDETAEVLETDFLDITDKIESGYNEQGLLGLVFHPDYDSTGYFYVNYTNNDGNTVVARYSVSTFDENVADESSELIIFEADQPYVNHNGGDLNFGADGYLYIGLGDGGSAGDPGNRAQNPEEKLGKIHRIDINSGTTYTVPPDNPFYGSADTLETIWSLGWRNPWRFSFDALTGDMWVGDVGQNLYEEVDFEPVNTGGKNYGWRCYEADDEFETGGCEDESFYTLPIFQYFHSFATGGFAITGGYVYRGTEFPDLNGYYICADHVSGNWWTIKSDGTDWITNMTDDLEADISTFGVDVTGEIYCADLYSGIIYH